jgi:hypothetical protein
MAKASLIARAVAVVAIAAFPVAVYASGPTEPTYLQPARCPALSAAPTATAAPLPDDFAAAEVRRCTYGLARDPAADSGWTWQSVQRATGPLDDLLRALRLPPPEHDGGDLVCTAIAVPPVALALTDRAGRTVMPAVPGTPCGTPLPEVTAAVQALSWTTVQRR